ncbi:MAG: YqaJ viral recombinase family protein [Porphyromonadaceae bacterium]|nr:YqaJ viral recombinase family protein [Porphyromonadaceae bacterium]
MARIIRPESREAWLDVRSRGIGSSDVATLLGLNPYDSPFMLYKRKLGLEPPKETTPLMELGHSLELAVADYFERTTGRGIIASSAGDWMYQHEEKPYLMASPDRLYWIDPNGAKHGKNAPANKAILECKSTQKRIDAEELPPYWFCQLQWQLGIAGMQQGSIAWLSSGRDFGWVDVAFNAEFFALMQDEAERFWTHNIEGRNEPELTTTSDVLTKFFASREGKTLRADSLIEQTVLDLKTLRAQIKELEAQEADLELSIKAAMADAEALIATDGSTLATWRTTEGGARLDTKALRAAHPELCAGFMKQTEGSRRFVLK